MHLTHHAASFLRAATGAAVLSSLCTAAHAGQVTPGWTFSGFGTVGVVHSDEKGADFSASAMKADGAGRTGAWSRHVDSTLGAQLDFRFNPRWSAVVQVVSEQQLDHSYRPRVEWANIKYQATPELALRLGRIALPMFIAADYRKVGYAYPWARMPLEVYGVLPISNSDGADMTWHWEGEALRSTTQAFYGYTDMPLAGSTRLRGKAIAGLSHTVERGAFSARVSLLTTRITLTLFPELFQGLNAFGPQGRDIASRVATDDKRARTMGIGLSYDPGQWFVTGEAGRSKVKSYLGSTRSVYAGAGYRRGDFTPYAGYARVWGTPPEGVSTLPLAGLPRPQAVAGATLNAGVAALLRTVPSQSTLSAGLRWDVAPNMAFKLQHERVTPRSGSRGMLINAAPGFRSGRTAQVSSVLLDFVF
ncbi:porin [Massilia niabensis]|uniref:Porin n=1 Tax=Massilia niabensis TaxID=544910 RepID=A0ABW0L065_9BURK